ncbi:MAG: dTDP-glucose 4,6-dehydratase, partial [Chlamydiae bacterium]|nr:dTDP-glucose 4,6-dehydratase [Chlamydiota bacterium]
LGQDKAYVIDSTKVRKTLGWSSRISLEEGLKGVVNWIDQFWDQVTKEPLDYVHKP